MIWKDKDLNPQDWNIDPFATDKKFVPTPGDDPRQESPPLIGTPLETFSVFLVSLIPFLTLRIDDPKFPEYLLHTFTLLTILRAGMRVTVSTWRKNREYMDKQQDATTAQVWKPDTTLSRSI